MTDIDPRSDIRTAYLEDDLMIMIPLAGEITNSDGRTSMWARRYEALARAEGMRAQIIEGDDLLPTVINLAVPVRTEGEDVLKMLDAARALLAKADAVDQSPSTSNAAEAIAKQWWARQQA
jgi:hypothetical protein